MNISDFFNNQNSQTLFIDRLSASLGITDKSRVKIVGVYPGSITVMSHVYPSNATNAVPMTQVNQNVQSAIQSGTLANNMATAGFGSMLGASSSYYTVAATTTTEDNGGLGLLLIIIIAVGGMVGIIIVIVIIVIMRRKKLETDVNTPTPNEIQMLERGGRITIDVD